MTIKKLKEFLNEGTWALPKNSEERKTQGTIFISKIEELKDEIYPVFGDDILFDGLDGAIRRIEELVDTPDEEIKERLNWKGEWVNDEHPLDRVGEYTLKQELIKELTKVTERYHGRIKDKTIEEALTVVIKKYIR